MPNQDDVRRLALALPETVEHLDRFAFSVRNKDKLKGFVWVWLERFHPKKARVPNPAVIAVRVASLDDKDVLLAMDPVVFFTEPHYNGYPAVMVRLEKVTPRMLEQLIREAWRCQAPKALAKTIQLEEAPQSGSATPAPSARPRSTPAASARKKPKPRSKSAAKRSRRA